MCLKVENHHSRAVCSKTNRKVGFEAGKRGPGEAWNVEFLEDEAGRSKAGSKVGATAGSKAGKRGEGEAWNIEFLEV